MSYLTLEARGGSRTQLETSAVYFCKIRKKNPYTLRFVWGNSPGLGPGRVRSWAMTSFLVFLLTPLPPQWILGVQSAHTNQRYSLLRATLKITKTTTRTCSGLSPRNIWKCFNGLWKILLHLFQSRFAYFECCIENLRFEICKFRSGSGTVLGFIVNI